jgi:hypothetical protein
MYGGKPFTFSMREPSKRERGNKMKIFSVIAVLAIMCVFPATAFAAPDKALDKSPVLADKLAENEKLADKFNIGHFEQQTLYFVNIFPQRVCDSDGSLCGNLTVDRLQERLDGTNAIFYRSDSDIRVRLAPGWIPLPGPINRTLLNSLCDLAPDIVVVWKTIAGKFVQVLAKSVPSSPNLIIDYEDYNEDGVGNNLDSEALCAPVDLDERNQAMHASGKHTQQLLHAATVFVRNGTKSISWDDTNKVWRYSGWTGNTSGCMSYVTNMTNNLSTQGTDFYHEFGHYLCNLHPFEGNPFENCKNSKDDDGDGLIDCDDNDCFMIVDVCNDHSWYDKVVNKIIEARDDFCPPPTECSTDDVIEYAFDHDDEINYALSDPPNWWELDNVGALNLNSIRVVDTPGDIGGSLWEELYGDGAKCGPEYERIEFPIDGPVYTLQPDRTNIMSYFKGCFPGEHSFTPIQILRSETAVKNLHRMAVTDSVVAKTWRNDTWKIIPDNSSPGGGSAGNHPPPKSVTSHILVNDGYAGAFGRVIVGVKLIQPLEHAGVSIELITPNGTAHMLKYDWENKVRRMMATQFYFNTSLKSKNGLWRLRVTETPHPVYRRARLYRVPGFLIDWQLQFEDVSGNIQ